MSFNRLMRIILPVTRSWYREGIRTPLIIWRLTIFWKYVYATQSGSAFSFQTYRCLDPAFINGLITGEEEKEQAGLKVLIYPNPTEGMIKISGINRGASRIYLYSPAGTCVYHAALNGTQSEVDVSHLPAGIYFYRVCSETGSFYSGKLVKTE